MSDRLKILFCFFSFFWGCLSLSWAGSNFNTSLTISSHLEPEQYLKHTLRKGDAPAYIVRRLNLTPITSRGGSLHHFYRLNPQLLEHERIPPGTVITLPITELPKNDRANKFFWRQRKGFVFFAANPRWNSDRMPASEDKNYQFGRAKMKIKVSQNSKIVRDFIAEGLVANSEIKGPVIIEIPVQDPNQNNNSFRSPATATLTSKTDQSQKFALKVGTQVLSRQYEISAGAGGGGTISSTSLVGLSFGANYRRSWLNLAVDVSFENEKMESSSTVAIEQVKNTRMDFSIKQQFTNSNWNVGFGGGAADTTVFSSQSPTLLLADYLLNPYLVAQVTRTLPIFKNIKTLMNLEGRYFLGAETSTLQLNSGYQGRLGLQSVYDYSDLLQFTGQGQLVYQDANPAFYTQKSLGAQLALGLIWNF